MRFRVVSEVEDGELRLTLSGRLDAQAYESFVKAVRPPKGRIHKVLIDVRGVQAIDSAGLGMLLITREAAGASRAAIRGASEELRKLLQTVNFGQLFELV